MWGVLGSTLSVERDGPRSGCELLAGLLVGRERVVWKGDEVESVAAVVADLDECSVGVGLHHGSDRPGRPSA
jgi:hypothetical protein